MDPDHTYDVIIIGGGLSGLSCAKYLHEQEVDVVVLEARDRVGGRTYTEQNEGCGYVDHGGAYVGPTQNYVLRLAEELDCPLYKVNDKEKLVYYWKKYVRRYRGFTAPPVYNPFALIDMINMFNKIDDFGTKIPVEAPYLCKHADKWDNMTMKQWMDQEIWTQECYDMVTLLVRSVVTAEPSEVSMLWFLWYIAQGFGVMRVTSIGNGAQERKFVGGAQTLSNKMAALLTKNKKLLLNQIVLQVSQDDDGVKITTSQGVVIKSRYLIIAISPNLNDKILFSPPLPALRNQLIQKTPMGSVIKIHIYYEAAFWRENDMSGAATILDNDAIVGFIMDDTKPDGSKPGLIGFIMANNARRLSNLSKNERKEAISEVLSKVFNCEEALKPVHYEEWNWMEEQFSGGCYTSTMAPGTLTNYGKVLREPVGRIYFAGTETATRWAGYMDGAIQAGERAAREVQHAMGQINDTDIWRDEPDNKTIYPEPFHLSFVEKNCPSIPSFIKGGILAAVVAAVAVYVQMFK